jgi:hypothetical protein
MLTSLAFAMLWFIGIALAVRWFASLGDRE